MQPALLVVVGHIHVLDTHGAAIRLLEGFDDIAKLGSFGQAFERADVEGLVQVSIVKTVEAKFEFVDFRPGQALERVEFGPAGTHGTIGGDKLANGGLFLDIATGDGRCRAESAVLSQFGKGSNNRRVGDVTGDKAWHLCQAVEVVAPFSRNGGRIVEIVFVKLFYKRRVAAKEHRAI